jgi:hypothetical protein
MSNDLDPLKNVFHLSEQEKQALETASSLIGTVSSVWGKVNTVKSALTALGLLSDADPVAELRQHIDQLKQQFNGVLAALDREQSMRAVADQLQSARTQLENLTQFAPEDPSAVGVDATWDELRPLVLNDSLQAVNTLGDPIYWKRVFFPELLYQKWRPNRADEHRPLVDGSPGLASGLVFDYRLTLPAYLEAVSIRLTILVAVVKNYRQKNRPELTKMANTLERYFKQIRDGIWPVMYPPRQVSDTPDNPLGGAPTWSHDGALVGAVEIYSACDQMAPWPAYEYPRAGWDKEGGDAERVAQWKQFLVRYAVRDWIRFKRLYDLVGLNAVASALVSLKSMAGIVPATLPDPATDPTVEVYTYRKIRGGDYSLGELARAIYDVGANSGQWGQHFFLATHMGGPVNPLSMREMLRILQTYSPEPYTSFRAALQQ